MSVACAVLLACACVAALAPLGCASVLGIDPDALADAAVMLCQCDQVQAAVPSCEETVAGRLEGATAETRAAWLEGFDSGGCSDCDKALGCYDRDPTCSNGTCSKSDECCGFTRGEGYCQEGQCKRLAKDCRWTGSSCTSEKECCGSESGSARCEPVALFGKVCVVSCEQNPSICGPCCKKPQTLDEKVCVGQNVGGGVCQGDCDEDTACDSGKCCSAFVGGLKVNACMDVKACPKP